MKFVGYVMRQQQIENLCSTGKVEGRKGRGRPGTKFLDSLAKSVEGGYTPAKKLRKTADRSKWLLMVANVLGDRAPQ